MTRERDILNKVLSSLRSDFIDKGWIIEWIDLRWGISHEASLDNRTMRICLEELNRCRRLSPRPNFIILAGERYGWIPLPETIPYFDIDLELLKGLGGDDKILFDTWYLLDRNALPFGEFVLKPRRSEYIDNDIYESVVVQNLRRILPKICKGPTADKLRLSATAHEIYSGLDSLSAVDTFVYRRHLDNIPCDVKWAFTDDDQNSIQKIQNVYSYIDRFALKENCLNVYGEYDKYMSGEYDNEIHSGMYSKLHKIITRAIEERSYKIPKNENDYHLAFASGFKELLVGRSDILHHLREYIHSDDRRPLLISSVSGVGKSSLMAMLVNQLTMNGEDVVVARFCGETQESSEAWSLLEGIYNDLYIHTDNYYRHPRKVLIMRNENQINALRSVNGIFKLRCNKKVVVVIDSINSVDASQMKFFHDLKWLDVELSEKIKVIVTCTPDKIVKESYEHIHCIQLQGMGSESMQVIENILKHNKRGITESQYEQVCKTIEMSDKSGLYLSILANYLLDIPSWLVLTKLPHTLDSLLDLILSNLRYPENHGPRIVDLSLRLLAATSMGLSDEEMVGILSADKVMVHDVRSQAMHSISYDSPAVPQIFWIRLQADLHGLIKRSQSPLGFHTVIAHSLIEDYIFRRLMPDHNTKFQTYEAVFNYLSPLISKGNPYAVYESGRLSYQMVVCTEAINRESKGADGILVADYKRILWNLLVDPVYILNKSVRFRSDLLREYSDFGALFSGTEYSLERLTRLGNEIVSLPNSGNTEALKSFIFNMPDECELRNIMSFDSSDWILMDVWKNLRVDHSVVHAAYDVEACPNISIDGERIASLSNNSSILKIINLAVSESNTISIPLGVKGLKLVSEDMLNVHVVSAPDCILLIESDTRKILKWNVSNANGFLSADGRFVTIWYTDVCLQYDRKNQTQDHFEMEIKALLPDSTGRFIWLIDGSNQLMRIEFQTTDTIGFKRADDIIFASSDICVVKNSSKFEIFSHFIIDGRHKFKNWTLPYVYIDKDQIWFDVMTDTLYLNIGVALQKIRVKNDHISVETLGCQPNFLTIKGHFALRSTPLSIVRWHVVFEDINIQTSYNGGIGSFSVSSDGLVAAMSIGINRMQEAYRYIIMLSNMGLYKICLPFENGNYDIITSIAVSPDGRYLGACSEAGEILLILRSDMSIIGRSFSKTEGCLHLSFSQDSRKLLAVGDHFISSPPPIIYVGDVLTGIIKEAPGQPDWNDSDNYNQRPWPRGESTFIQGDRYVRLGGLDIWDLENERMVFPPNINIPFHYTKLPESENNSIGHGPRECIFEHPISGLLICASKGIQTEIDLSDGTIRQYECDKDLIGISADGHFFFYLDSHSNLWVYCGSFCQMIAEGIVAVYPSIFFPMELYAYTNSGYVCLLNIYGQKIARAYVPDLWHAIPTKSGLAIATPRGPLLLTLKSMWELDMA